MKKIFIILALIFLTSCNTQNSTNDKVISQINIDNINNTGLFNNCEMMSDELLDINKFKLETFDELIMCSSELADDPSLYIIALASDGMKNDCRAQLNYYLDNRLTAYLDYNPEAANMIDNRLEQDYGDYMIYIISKDNELAFNKLTE